MFNILTIWIAYDKYNNTRCKREILFRIAMEKRGIQQEEKDFRWQIGLLRKKLVK